MFRTNYKKKESGDDSKTTETPTMARSLSPDINMMRQIQQIDGNQKMGEYLRQMEIQQSSDSVVEEKEQIAMIQTEEVQPPYDFLFDKLKGIEVTEKENKEAIIELIQLKEKYDKAEGNLAKLKVADEISQKARELPESQDILMSEIRYTLVKFPHVILGEEEKIKLADIVDMMQTIDKTREIGLVNMVDANEKGSLGLFLGPNNPSMQGTGATVSAPGSKSTKGFEGVTSNFIVHTHPRELETQKSHGGELAADIEAAKGLEMVRDANNQTFFYNKSGAKNVKKGGGFTNELIEPTFYKFRIQSFTNLLEGEKYTGKIPSEEERSIAVQQATAEGEEIWGNVERAQKKLTTEALSREEYLENLSIMDIGLLILDNGNLNAIKEWKEKFPIEVEGGFDFLNFL